MILASASPRRRELLAQLALPFSVMPADVEEQQLPHEAPGTIRVAHGTEKAAHLAQQYPDALVLGADTIVVLDQQILGKPGIALWPTRCSHRLSGRQQP